MKESRLYRSTTQRSIGGVAGGIAEFFDMDPVIVRIIFLLMVFLGGSGVLVYLVLWIAIPERPVTAQMFTTPSSADLSGGPPLNESQPYSATPEHAAHRMSGSVIGGIILIAIGVLALSARFIPRVSFHDLWPAVLVIVGVILIVSAMNHVKPKRPSE
ncbi:MAG: PspC domain-containing protein [Bacteroidales bacterium]|nr:PspC domain-containing protein [Bacteroidales bacterium]MDZ4204566.1 PspC domain-containing protein [Bacteroidales bacterium]